MDIEYYKKFEPIFGSWHITRLIGEGSFGKVFEIERESVGMTYKAALKAITVPANEAELQEAEADGMDEASVREYFGSFVQELAKEFALMSKLKGNSNVVSYEDHQVIEHAGSIGWDILIRMELLTPLNEYIKKNTVTRQDVIRLGIDMCKALELCQKYNIIHRDVKPENIFLSETGDYKLGDFGIARTVEKTTGALSKKGTYTYMAPEVYKDEPYGSTVDIYSLGIVLYRLLNNNRTPFLPDYPAPITYQDREQALAKRFSGKPLPAPAHAEGRLSEIVLRACAYEPKERYHSPQEMRQALEAIFYNREEGKAIYPDGDEVPEDSVHYADTDRAAGRRASAERADATLGDLGRRYFKEKDTGDEPEDLEKTTSDFGRRKGSEKTTGDFGRREDPEKTTGDFGRRKGSEKTTGDFGRRKGSEKTAGAAASSYLAQLAACVPPKDKLIQRTDLSVLLKDGTRVWLPADKKELKRVADFLGYPEIYTRNKPVGTGRSLLIFLLTFLVTLIGGVLLTPFLACVGCIAFYAVVILNILQAIRIVRVRTALRGFIREIEDTGQVRLGPYKDWYARCRAYEKTAGRQ